MLTYDNIQQAARMLTYVNVQQEIQRLGQHHAARHLSGHPCGIQPEISGKPGLENDEK